MKPAIGNYRDRLYDELNEVQSRTTKLGMFLKTWAYKQLKTVDKILLNFQYQAMKVYLYFLIKRINRA